MSTQSSSQSLDSWIVHKFGGTSVGSSSSIRKCIDIIRPLVSNNRVAVVVSAMGGKPKVTDLLLQSVHHAAKNDMHAAKEKLQGIRVKHIDCVQTNPPEVFNKLSDLPRIHAFGIRVSAH